MTGTQIKGGAGGAGLLMQERGRLEECSRCDDGSQPNERKKGREAEKQQAEEEMKEVMTERRRGNLCVSLDILS